MADDTLTPGAHRMRLARKRHLTGARPFRGEASAAPDGREYLLPDAVRDLPDEVIIAEYGDLPPRRVLSVRDELETAMRFLN